MISRFTSLFDKFDTFVSSFRSTKSYQEEENLAKSEIASLKEVIEDDDNESQDVSVMKIIYLYMLGYDVRFAEFRCARMMSSQKFLWKKVGYLACSLMFDEYAEFHQLVIHTINSDIVSEDPFIQAMALSAFASIISEKMAISSCRNILHALTSPHTFVNSKAAICAARIVEIHPECCSLFVPVFLEKIQESDPAVKISFCVLGISIVENGVQELEEFWVELSRNLLNIIKVKPNSSKYFMNLSTRTLQIQAIKLLTLLSEKKSREIPGLVDVLSEYIGVCLPAESAKRHEISQFAIPIESINALVTLKLSDQHLFLVKESLGKLLKFKDKNIRLVALKSYREFVSHYPGHCDFELLKEYFEDGEVYPVKLALEAIFLGLTAKIDDKIVTLLIDIIDAFDLTLKEFVINNLISSIIQFPSSFQSWKLSSLLKILSISGRFSNDEHFAKFIAMLMCSPSDLLSNFIHKAFVIAIKSPSNNFLIQLVCWCIGEKGQCLLSEAIGSSKDVEINSTVVLRFLQSTVMSASVSQNTKYVALTALPKVLVFSPQLKQSVLNILQSFRHHVDVEIQKRSCEYAILISHLEGRIGDLFPPYEPPTNLKIEQTSHSSTSNDNSFDLSSYGLSIPRTQSDAFFSSILGGSNNNSDATNGKMNSNSGSDNITQILNSHSINVLSSNELEMHLTPRGFNNSQRVEFIAVILSRTKSVLSDIELKVAPAKNSTITISPYNCNIPAPNILNIKQLDASIVPETNNVKFKVLIQYNAEGQTRSISKVVELSREQFSIKSS